MGAAKSQLDFGDTENSLMHADNVEPDFSGWATRANVLCSDGRTILPDAFKHQDKMKVPLVWQHCHDKPENVLGHAILEARDGDIWCSGYFNETDGAKNAKELVKHDDINSLSIFANMLKETAKRVSHGVIREVSLVMARANPGATIENIQLQHGDDMVEISDEVIIKSGEALHHGDKPSTPPKRENSEDPTVQEIYDGMTEDQRGVAHMMVNAAIEQATADALQHNDNNDGKGKKTMKRNLFEQQREKEGGSEDERHVISHDDMRGIFADADRRGSLKAAVEDYALEHGIENLEVLFPDAKAVGPLELDKRRTEWVSGVLNGTNHTPFSRIKSLFADLTHADARAKGYIKGSFKKEEWVKLAKRVTTPATIYKKQKLDRDDIVDVTDLDIVAWLKAEMRLMLDEEIARAVLIGDGRAIDDEDKVKDPMGGGTGEGIRSILHDDDLYAATITVNIDDANSSPIEIVDGILTDMRLYKGSGTPTFYTTLPVITKILLARDTMGRRLYRTKSDVAAELMVSDVVEVEVMEEETDLVGIIVNLRDYTLGADRGGDVALFDDFDIDYNQYKYLIETRLSGALTKIRSAIIVKKAASSATRVDNSAITAPSFNSGTGVVTIPTKTGVVYKNADTNATLTAGAQTALAAGATLNVRAVPASGYFFDNNVEDEFSFTRPNA